MLPSPCATSHGLSTGPLGAFLPGSLVTIEAHEVYSPGWGFMTRPEEPCTVLEDGEFFVQVHLHTRPQTKVQERMWRGYLRAA